MAVPTVTTAQLKWAEDDVVDSVSGQDNKAEPSTTMKDDGWSSDQYPPFNWFNFWMNGIWQYIAEIYDNALQGVYTFVGNKNFQNNITCDATIQASSGFVGKYNATTTGYHYLGKTASWDMSTIGDDSITIQIPEINGQTVMSVNVIIEEGNGNEYSLCVKSDTGQGLLDGGYYKLINIEDTTTEITLYRVSGGCFTYATQFANATAKVFIIYK